LHVPEPGRSGSLKSCRGTVLCISCISNLVYDLSSSRARSRGDDLNADEVVSVLRGARVQTLLSATPVCIWSVRMASVCLDMCDDQDRCPRNSERMASYSCQAARCHRQSSQGFPGNTEHNKLQRAAWGWVQGGARCACNVLRRVIIFTPCRSSRERPSKRPDERSARRRRERALRRV
jgi:hypothetical protein